MDNSLDITKQLKEQYELDFDNAYIILKKYTNDIGGNL